MTLVAIFESTLINEIGLQFSKNILSFPFLSIKVTTACFWEFDIRPSSKEWLKTSVISTPTEFQNVL